MSEAAHTQLKDWRTPTDLQPASFTDSPKPTEPHQEPTKEPQKEPQPRINTFEKILPLLGSINNKGSLDITSVLDLLDKSGQGFGAFGQLLPLVAPLLKNGFGKKKPTEDIVDLSTINLDN